MKPSSLRSAMFLALAFSVSACDGVEWRNWVDARFADRQPPIASVDDEPAAPPPSFNAMLNAGALVDRVPNDVRWTDDGAGLWFVVDQQADYYNVAAESVTASVDLANVRAVLVQRFGPAAGAPIRLSQIALMGGQAVVSWNGVDAHVSLETGEVVISSDATPADSGAFSRNLFLYNRFPVDPARAPGGHKVATVRNGNIFVRRDDAAPFRALTTSGGLRREWDLVSRRIDFSIHPAASVSPWSPDEKRLFSMRIDRRAMPETPETRIMEPPFSTVNHDRFSPGGPYYVYEPAIIDAETGEATFITGPDLSKDFLLFLGWSDDSRAAWFGAISRDFSRIAVYAADARSGRARLVLTEEGERGMRSPHRIYYAGNLGFTLLKGGRGFIWESDRSGVSEYYHYDPDGELVRQLTNGTGPVASVARVDYENKLFYFVARSDPARPYDEHLHVASLDGGATRRLTDGAGVHKVSFSADGGHFADLYSAPSTPPTLKLHRIANTGDVLSSVELARADISRLQAAGWREPIEFTVKASDEETDVRGVMYLPASFDPEKSYPVIEDIYGGPTVLHADRTFLASDFPGANFPLALAQAGYIVVKMDTPGTPGRSRAFERAVIDKWFAGLIDDHAAALTHLGEAYPFVNAKRVGIYGHSWGGQNTLAALALRGDVYKAGVATAVGANVGEYFRDAFMESYLGAPSQNPERWAELDILPYLDRIEQPLLMGVGTQDHMIYPAMLQMSQRLIARGFHHEFMLAPGMGHGIYGAQGAYFGEKTLQFFLKHLPPTEIGSETPLSANETE